MCCPECIIQFFLSSVDLLSRCKFIFAMKVVVNRYTTARVAGGGGGGGGGETSSQKGWQFLIIITVIYILP